MQMSAGSNLLFML
jgi:hypothetical protein